MPPPLCGFKRRAAPHPVCPHLMLAYFRRFSNLFTTHSVGGGVMLGAESERRWLLMMEPGAGAAAALADPVRSGVRAARGTPRVDPPRGGCSAIDALWPTRGEHTPPRPLHTQSDSSRSRVDRTWLLSALVVQRCSSESRIPGKVECPPFSRSRLIGLLPRYLSSTLPARKTVTEPSMKRSHQAPTRLTDNLRHAVELTELGLALRCAVLRQQNPHRDVLKQVMHEIRLAKERAWRQSLS